MHSVNTNDLNAEGTSRPASTAIIVLGSPNDDAGRLLPNALARIEEAVRLYFSTPQSVLVLTGGFGPFNATDRPHAEYLKQAALERGIPAADVLTCPNASHTVDDAVHSLGLLVQSRAISRAVVVTSNFHVERARLIFTTVYRGVPLDVVGVDPKLTPDALTGCQAHELAAVSRLTSQGGVMLGFAAPPQGLVRSSS